MARRKQIRHTRRPFDDNNSLLFEQLGKAVGFEIIGPADAVGVEVKKREAAGVVDIQENIGWAADGASIAAEPLKQAANELRLACAQISVKGNALAGVQS